MADRPALTRGAGIAVAAVALVVAQVILPATLDLITSIVLVALGVYAGRTLFPRRE